MFSELLFYSSAIAPIRASARSPIPEKTKQNYTKNLTFSKFCPNFGKI